jgi:hypothetical protein
VAPVGEVGRSVAVALAGTLGLAGALVGVALGTTRAVALTLRERSTALTLRARDTALTLAERVFHLTIRER